jgi:exopolyphosphatase/guanosine-5'-triphosphate,3'-diphosphate pyrophosphatase
MKSSRRAVVDVGTNSVKLLVADVSGTLARPVCEESHQTRLGAGFYPDYVLQAGPIAETAKTVAAFAAKAAGLGAGVPRIVATSAARDAKNQLELIEAIQKASGLPVEVISGEEEANYAFLGITTDPLLAQKPLLLLDVGGGSTELILAENGQKRFSHSFAMGTVRLLQQLHPCDPPHPDELTRCRAVLKDFVRNEVAPPLAKAAHQRESSASLQLIGTGGTASILGCMEARLTTFDRQRLEATPLSLERVHWHMERLWHLPLTERRQIIGLPANRADVILTGAAIYEAIMRELDFKELKISTRGLRFAIVLEGTEVAAAG